MFISFFYGYVVLYIAIRFKAFQHFPKDRKTGNWFFFCTITFLYTFSLSISRSSGARINLNCVNTCLAMFFALIHSISNHPFLSLCGIIGTNCCPHLVIGVSIRTWFFLSGLGLLFSLTLDVCSCEFLLCSISQHGPLWSYFIVSFLVFATPGIKNTLCCVRVILMFSKGGCTVALCSET